MAAVPEKSLERYELVERIAVGGMAEVFRAKAFGAHGFEKTLAIKRILPELAQDPEFEARFISEAKLAVRLSHANIVQVLDFGRFGGSLFIAMEFVDGLDLATMLKYCREHQRRVPLTAAFQIAIDLARGLDFAHKHQVVHRDVSPSNLLLSKAGEVKIADFGIAMAAATHGHRGRTSSKRRIMGKWRYMSPEQTRGDALGTSSDLFSAAAVMFELFTGQKLFGGDEADDIIRNIHEMPIPAVSTLREGLPPRLDEVLGKALERDPEKRHAKAAEMLRALTEISYESSLVVTALDVAEAVAEAISANQAPALSGDAPKGIDDLIRQQLGGGGGAQKPATARRTAVETQVDAGLDPTEISDDAISIDTKTATVVKKGVDPHGITVWELESGSNTDENTVAAVPSAIRTGRRSGAAQIIEEEPASAEPSSPRRRVGVGIAVAAAAALALGLGGWILFGRGGDSKPAPPAAGAIADAGASVITPPARSALRIDSEPQGATVWVDGAKLSSPTPTTVSVQPEKPHRIEVELAGYRRWTDEAQVASGETLRVKAELRALLAVLEVRSNPEDAAVSLGGTALGRTPLKRDNLEPREGAWLVISKPGYRPLREKITLRRGKRTVIERTLRAAVRYGQVNIYIFDSWAKVYFRGKQVAQGQQIRNLRLPVGTHKLRLVNPASKRLRDLVVTVSADKPSFYRTRL